MLIILIGMLCSSYIVCIECKLAICVSWPIHLHKKQIDGPPKLMKIISWPILISSDPSQQLLYERSLTTSSCINVYYKPKVMPLYGVCVNFEQSVLSWRSQNSGYREYWSVSTSAYLWLGSTLSTKISFYHIPRLVW
jgi:hypothetical protein